MPEPTERPKRAKVPPGAPIASFDDFPIVTESALPTTEAPEASFEEFPLIESTVSEKIGAFGRQATGGLLETGGALAGMTMGAAIGGAGGPFAPVTVPLGAGVGFVAGMVSGRGAKSLLGIPDIEELPPDQRPFGVAGEVVGSGTPFMAAPVAAARVGARLPPSRVGNFINRIIDTAARAPGTFTAAEASALGSAAVAGGVSEAFLPGQRLPRLGAEVAGGLFNPSRLIVGGGRFAMDAGRRALEALSPAARETRAAKILQDVVAQAGEDPQVLAALLRESGIPGVVQTSAQKTGSPALAALEAKIASGSPKFASDVRKTAEDSLSALENMIIALRGTGDPHALTMAAELQQARFRTLLTSRLQMAEQEVAETAAKITQDTPAARAELSKVGHRVISEALEDSRAVERELWGKVGRDLPATAGNVIGRHAEIRADLLPEETLPEIVEGFVQRTSEAGGGTTSGEWMRFRSRALALAREAEGQGKFNEARIYGEMAEAALEDLDAMFSGPASGVLRTFGEVSENYAAARTFSRELNETFTRSFAGRAMARDPRGGARIPPELMMTRALGTGKEAANLRFQELERATRFLVTKQRPTARTVENVDTLLDAQERLLRLTAAETINPNTGRVSSTRLAKLLRDNEALLNRFPELRKDLEAAVKSEARLKDLERLTSDVSRVVDQQAMFARLAKFENPSDAIRAAVAPGSKTPIKDLEAMAKVAKRGGPDAIDGLKASIWEHAARQATTTRGFSFARLRSALFAPIRPGQPSLIEFMQRSGLMTADDVGQAKKLLAEAEKISGALESGTDLERLVAEPDALFDLVLRVAGARFGARLAEGGPAGSTLIAAGRGSEFARKVFEKVPERKVKDVLIEAAINPDFAAMLLETPTSEGRQLTLMRQIHAYLLQAGMTIPEDENGGFLPGS